MTFTEHSLLVRHYARWVTIIILLYSIFFLLFVYSFSPFLLPIIIFPFFSGKCFKKPGQNSYFHQNTFDLPPINIYVNSFSLLISSCSYSFCVFVRVCFYLETFWQQRQYLLFLHHFLSASSTIIYFSQWTFSGLKALFATGHYIIYGNF